MKKTVIVILAVFALSLPLLAMPKHGGGARDGGTIDGAEKVMRFADELELTDKQIKQIRDMMSKAKRTSFEARNNIQLSQWDIQDEIKKNKSDKGKINKLIDSISENQKKMMKLRVDNMLEVKKILSAKQFDKLTILMESNNEKNKKKSKFFGKKPSRK